MKARPLAAAVAGASLGLLAFVAAFIAELVLAGSVLGAGNAIGWDPVSFWRQSFHGKLTVLAIIALPLLLPLLAFDLVFRFIYRRLLRRTVLTGSPD